MSETMTIHVDENLDTTFEVPEYWTEQQRETISSLHRLSAEDNLWEMTYKGDYRLPELLQFETLNERTGRDLFKQLVLPESPLVSPPTPKIEGCSAISMLSDKGHNLLGRNYDWTSNGSTVLILHTAPESGYKSVTLCDCWFFDHKMGDNPTVPQLEQLLYSPLIPFDGVNEKGLAVGVLILEEHPVHQNTGKEKLPIAMLIRYFLDNAATVKEAEEALQKVDVLEAFVGGERNFHWMVADAEGDRAVFEYVDNELHVLRDVLEVKPDFSELGESMPEVDINKAIKLNYGLRKPYQITTNFYLTKGVEQEKGTGFWRYQQLQDQLESNPTPTFEQAMDYMESVRFFMKDQDTYLVYRASGKDVNDPNTWEWHTCWSSVYDTVEKTGVVCVNEKYDKQYVLTVE